jgi:hypothetical protein
VQRFSEPLSTTVISLLAEPKLVEDPVEDEREHEAGEEEHAPGVGIASEENRTDAHCHSTYGEADPDIAEGRF